MDKIKINWIFVGVIVFNIAVWIIWILFIIYLA